MRFCALFCLLLVFSLGSGFSAPSITVWNGSSQSFGQIGNPQTAINILGNVSDADGILSLEYRLNGGSAINLSRGPDTRRLLSAGDFNVDIPTSSLNSGSNTVLIKATNNLGDTSTTTVTVNYTSGHYWPLPYSINWTTAGTIPNVARIVDGHWTLLGGSIRPTYLGYDRLVAIGDKTWTDYEVTVPITITSIDSAGFAFPSNGPGVGLLFRWTGHTDTPISGWQPKTGYLPLGAIGWYNWDQSGGGVRLKMYGNNLNLMQQDNSGDTLTFGLTYIFKMRVTTIPGVGGEYKMKVWQAGQTEPGTWTLSGMQSLSDPQAGSVCLVAHHVNATFGNITITPTQVRANIKALLQGPYSTPGDSMRTNLRPLLPVVQPYNVAPWNYGGTESVVSIPDSVVDWVLLELRTTTASSSKVSSRAAFIKRNGRIVDTDGMSDVAFSGVAAGNYYVVLRHRNHLPVMTASAIALSSSSSLYSFTTAQSQAFGTTPMVLVATGVYALAAGDANASGGISADDASAIFSNMNTSVYHVSDINLSGIVTSADAGSVFENLNKSSQVP